MGSLISHIVFTPPKKHVDQDQEIEGDVILTTSHGSQIQVKSIINNEKYLYMLVSHGNSEDVNSVYDWASKILCNYLNVNVIMYEYTGYGANQNNFRCSEQHCYNDIDTVYNYMVTVLKIPPGRIVLFGRSLGTGPSVYLAAKEKVAGLIMNSGFLSIYRVVLNFRWTMPGDMFPNIDRIKNVECPVCIIHSIKDEVIPFYHAKEMYRNVKNKFNPLYIDGTSHNTVDKISDDAYKHMQKFFKFLDPEYESIMPLENEENNNNI
jgi:fermentation-respiration switch protein FrsA (DUF1100 family)